MIKTLFLKTFIISRNYCPFEYSIFSFYLLIHSLLSMCAIMCQCVQCPPTLPHWPLAMTVDLNWDSGLKLNTGHGGKPEHSVNFKAMFICDKTSTLSTDMTNQRLTLRSRDLLWPMRCPTSGVELTSSAGAGRRLLRSGGYRALFSETQTIVGLGLV